MESQDRGTRFFLKRLRETMALALKEESRLAKIVALISGHMVAEVCSIYLRRPGGEMELYATEGLNPKAVGRTVLAAGEGLIGAIARHAQPLILQDAQNHPAFSYRPETGEEIYKSFLGVPIIRMGHVLGVLSVQNRRRRAYSEDNVELMETAAMLMAELLAGRAFHSRAARAAPNEALHLKGASLARGLAMGEIVLHQPRIHIETLLAEDSDREHERLDAALYDLRAELDEMRSAPSLAEGGEERQILEAHRIFADDRSWQARLHEAIETGLSAEASVERVQENIRARFLHQSNPYLKERLHDLDDLANRLLRHLTGGGMKPESLPEEAILVARNMGPAELLDYDKDRLRGIALEEGSALAHATIVARSLGIPLIGRLPDLLTIAAAGSAAILDGDTGALYLNPDRHLRAAYREKRKIRARRLKAYRARARRASRTKDGAEIALLMNVGLLMDLPQLEETGAEGIGLVRTELQFMIHAAMPRLSAQVALYRQILAAAGENPVAFRTLDIGGDKILPYMRNLGIRRQRGENPALGWRAIRIALDKPVLLRYQLRALLQAAAGKALHILFPMIATVEEYHQARALLRKEETHAERHGLARPRSVSVGAMLEVPSLIWQLEALLPESDFLAIGTNDLLQFFFASDRGDPHVGERYDPLNRGFLAALRHIHRKAEAAGVPATVCGEMAANPLHALALIGIGFRKITLAPSAIGPVKEAIGLLDLRALQEEMPKIFDDPASSPREILEDFAKKHKIPTVS